MTLPTFIVIGPGKTGSTWLYKCLEAHPEIRLARNTKETFFFDKYYERGLAWYEKFFAGFEGAHAIGEVSNTYFFSEAAPARIAKQLPEVKLISVLRNPIDRLISSYLFKRRHARTDEELEHIISDRLRMVPRNFYDVHLERFLRVFPREHLHVALYDDIKSDPTAMLRDIYAFIGVDPNFHPEVAKEKIFAAGKPRMTAVARALRPFTLWLRESDMHGLLTWAKLNSTVQTVLYKPVTDSKRPQLSSETRERLRDIYRPHIERVESMIGRDLGHWK